MTDYKLRVHWDWNPDWLSDDDRQSWKLPEAMAFSLRMAEVRGEVDQEESGASTRLHQKYQHACLSLDQGNFTQSVRLFAELLQNAPSGFQDAEVRLRRSLQGLGYWDPLLKKAKIYEQRLAALVRRRQWSDLENALATLDKNVELRTALASVTDLKKFKDVLDQGLGWEQAWASTRRRAAVFSRRGRPDKAAVLLRKANLGGLNDDLQYEARRLRLEALQSWVDQPDVSPHQSLQIYHEMFALADESIEPGMLAELARKIQALENSTEQHTIDLDRLNVSFFTRPDTKKAGSKQEKKQKSQAEQTQHELYLSGVLAMQEHRWNDALQCFREIAGYRQADVFIKSLESLKNEGDNRGTVDSETAVA